MWLHKVNAHKFRHRNRTKHQCVPSTKVTRCLLVFILVIIAFEVILVSFQIQTEFSSKADISIDSEWKEDLVNQKSIQGFTDNKVFRTSPEDNDSENMNKNGNQYLSKLCFIVLPTSFDRSKHKSRVNAIRDTWASNVHRSRLFFVGNETYPDDVNVLQKSKSVYPFGGGVLLKALIESYERCPKDTLWFVKGDTVTYFIIESLIRYLASLEHKEKKSRADFNILRKEETIPPISPMFLGKRLKQPKEKAKVFNSGGAGYVLSRSALKMVVDSQNHNNHIPSHECDTSSNMGEDLLVASCLRSLGVEPKETRDINGRERFHSFDPGGLALNKLHSWYITYTWYGFPDDDGQGGSLCARGSVSFHYIEGNAARMIYRFLGNQTDLSKLSNAELLKNVVPKSGFGGYGIRPTERNCDRIFFLLLKWIKPGFLDEDWGGL